jgi:hypothetical protein
MVDQVVECETHKDLFDFLNLEKDPKMHWTNIFCWDIIATLGLGSQPKQRLTKVWAKNET